MRIRLLIGFASVLVLAMTAIAADDPFVGTWKLNLTQSKYNPSETAPKSETYNMKVEENTLKGITETTRADGQVRRSESAIVLDGKDHPFVIPTLVDTISATRADQHTILYVLKKSGKVMEHASSVISANGTTLTSTRKRINERGEEITTIAIYDKQ